MIKMHTRFISAILVSFIFGFTGLQAAGTFGKGKIFVKKLKKFESGGLVFESWEGEFIVDSYNSKQKCKEKDYECFKPVDRIVKFSVRPKNAKVVNFLRENKGKGGFLLSYRHHKFEAIALSTDFEIIGVQRRATGKPAGVADKKVVRKTGSRNFSFKGEILQLGSQGTIINTYEGLYKDHKTGNVHPFSITNDVMANFAKKAMSTSSAIYIGISVALVSGLRKSDHDVFEINYKEDAGKVEEKSETNKPDDD